MHIEQNSQVEDKMKLLSENMKEKQIEAFGVSRQSQTIILIKFTFTKGFSALTGNEFFCNVKVGNKK